MLSLNGRLNANGLHEECQLDRFLHVPTVKIHDNQLKKLRLKHRINDGDNCFTMKKINGTNAANPIKRPVDGYIPKKMNLNSFKFIV